MSNSNLKLFSLSTELFKNVVFLEVSLIFFFPEPTQYFTEVGRFLLMHFFVLMTVFLLNDLTKLKYLF